MASILASDFGVNSAENSGSSSEDVRVIPKKVTTLEFDKQVLIQSEQSNKTPEVWTISKNEKFGKILTIKDVIDLIFEGEEHLWKLSVSPASPASQSTEGFAHRAKKRMSVMSAISQISTGPSQDNKSPVLNDAVMSIGESFVKHGRNTDHIHQYFGDLDSRRCCLNVKKSEDTTIPRPLKRISDDGRIQIKKGNNQGQNQRPKQRLNSYDKKIYEHVLHCASYPILSPPTDRSSPTMERTDSLLGIEFDINQRNGSSNFIQNLLFTKLKRAFRISDDLHNQIVKDVFLCYRSEDYMKALLSDLHDQKFHLENNTCLFYHRNNFRNLSDDEDYENWKQNEILKLEELIACLSEYEPVIRAPRFNIVNAHESYSVLIGKLIMLDMKEKNADDQCLTMPSHRLLNEFSLRFGVRKDYHMICVLHFMIENMIFEDKFLRRLKETFVNIMNLLNQNRAYLVYKEENAIKKFLKNLHYKIEYGLFEMYFLYKTSAISEKGVADLLDLLEFLITEKTNYDLWDEFENPNITTLIKEYFKVSAFKTYEVASLKRANTEKSADILVGVLKEAREVGKVYHEIIQKCTQLDCKCPDLMWVIESSFYNCIMQDVKQVTESFADIDITKDINTDMLALAYHLDKLDKEWNINPQDQKWRTYFHPVLKIFLESINIYVTSELTKFVKKDNYGIFSLENLPLRPCPIPSAPQSSSRPISKGNTSAFSAPCTFPQGTVVADIRRGSEVVITKVLHATKSPQSQCKISPTNLLTVGTTKEIETKDLPLKQNASDICDLDEMDNNTVGISSNTGDRNETLPINSEIVVPIIDDIITSVVNNRTEDANENNVEVFCKKVIDEMVDEVLEIFEDKTNINQSTRNKEEFKDFAKDVIVSLLDSNLFDFNFYPSSHHNISPKYSKQREDDDTRNVTPQAISKILFDEKTINTFQELKVPKDLPCPLKNPSIDNIASLDIPGPSKATNKNQKAEDGKHVFSSHQSNKISPTRIRYETNPKLMEIPDTGGEFSKAFSIKDQRDFSDSAVIVSGSLSDLLVSVLRFSVFSENVCMLMSPFIEPSFNVDDELSGVLCETRHWILQKVLDMVSKLFVQYSANLLNMDLCGTDMLKENILLIENKQEYFEKKKHFLRKLKFNKEVGCRHSTDSFCFKENKSCIHLGRLLNKSKSPWELISKEMCFRINNLHNLSIALEDVQQRIAALLKVEITTFEETAKSKEHSKGTRNVIVYQEKRLCKDFIDCRLHLKGSIDMQIHMLTYRILDIFEKLLNNFARIKNKSIIDHMTGSVQYIFEQNKLLKRFMYKEQRRTVVLLIWEHLMKRFEELLDSMKSSQENPRAKSKKILNLIIRSKDVLNDDLDIVEQLDEVSSVICFRLEIFGEVQLEKPRDLYEDIKDYNRTFRAIVKEGESWKCYEEEMYKFVKNLKKKRNEDGRFTGEDFAQYLAENENCLDIISNELGVSFKYKTEKRTKTIGKHFLDKGFILSHGIPKRFTPDHSRPGEVVSPMSHKKGATDNVVMVMGELVDVGKKGSAGNSVDKSDNDTSPATTTVDSDIMTEFYTCSDAYYSFLNIRIFSMICLLGKMYYFFRNYDKDIRTKVKGDIESIMIYECLRNYDPIAETFVDQHPDVQVKRNFCDAALGFLCGKKD